MLDRVRGEVSVGREISPRLRDAEQPSQDAPVRGSRCHDADIGPGEPSVHDLGRFLDRQRIDQDPTVRREAQETDEGGPTESDLTGRTGAVPPPSRPLMKRAVPVDGVDEEIDVRKDHG